MGQAREQASGAGPWWKVALWEQHTSRARLLAQLLAGVSSAGLCVLAGTCQDVFYHQYVWSSTFVPDCREALQERDAALEDLRAILALQPGNKDAAAKLQQLQGEGPAAAPAAAGGAGGGGGEAAGGMAS